METRYEAGDDFLGVAVVCGSRANPNGGSGIDGYELHIFIKGVKYVIDDISLKQYKHEDN